MRFTKIYVEITNICNLNCSFCSKDNRKLKEMTKEEFAIVINKIKDYTKTIYLCQLLIISIRIKISLYKIAIYSLLYQ